MPGSMRSVTVAIHERSMTVDEFLTGLEGVLTRLTADPGRWILIADVERSEGRYIQFLAREDGVLCAEVSSNASLRGDSRLSEDQVRDLVADGWLSPNDDRQPNFWWEESVESIPAIVEATTVVVRGVFALGHSDGLFVKLFRSALDDPPARHPVEA